MIDNKTPYLGLPLPDLENQQDEDVPRIAGALGLLDVHAAENDAQMAETESRVEALEEGGKAQRDRQDALDERLTGAEAKLPDLAGPDKAGIVKIGKGIDVTGDGTISVEIPEVPLASPERPGLVRPDGESISLDSAGGISLSPDRKDSAASYTSGGNTPNATGFKMSDGSDIAVLFGKLDAVQNTTTGSGAFLKDAVLSVDGKTVKLSRTYGPPTYCGYCTHCGYCTYCSYCNCSNCNCSNG